MNCVMTLRPKLSVPSGEKSDGLAQTGFSIVLIARRPDSSASSGAASAISTMSVRITRPTIPGR